MQITSAGKILLLLALLLTIFSCTKPTENMYKKSTTLMHTLVSITVVSDSENNAEAAIDAAFKEISDLEQKLSFWTDDSEIAYISRNAGINPIEVSPVTQDVIEKSLYISQKTDGAFDPTIGPVIRLWDFRKNIIPSSSALDNAINLVDYNKLSLNGNEVFLGRKGMSFDTGGIAKGYASDRAVDVLKRMGIRSGLVSVAGDIRAFGTKPDGTPWNVGIRNPRATGDEDSIMATLELRDEAISTSGDYERFFIKDGRRYHHLLSPKTGYPAEGLMSVSIVTKEAVYTDGFATGVFVMGTEEGMEMMKSEGLEGLLVGTDGRVYVTDGLRDRIQWRNMPVQTEIIND